MIFANLTITNFGVYEGVNEFELRPRDREGELRPVVLFGGKNGAGKTTILEAIRLCLYGRLALGTRVRYRDYEDYIVQHMHRGGSDKMPSRSASVGLVFEHTHVSVRNLYNATRTWFYNGNELTEEISIYKDGELFTEIAPEHWDDFLRDLIPPGLADLFFFDGEQIQALANDDTEQDTLATAIGSLFNLELVERLQADLTTYLRKQDAKNKSVLEHNLEEAQAAVDSVQKRLTELRQDEAHYRTRLEGTTKRLEEARQKLLREGAGLIEDRVELERRQELVDQRLEEVKSTIRDLSATLIPFAVTPEWCQRLFDRLRYEEEMSVSIVAHEAKLQQRDELVTALNSQDAQHHSELSLSDAEWRRLAEFVGQLATPHDVPEDITIRHPISSIERGDLYHWITSALNEVPDRLHELTVEMENLEEEQAQITQALSQIPDEVVANPLLEKFYDLSESMGNLQERYDSVREKIYRAEIDLAEVDRTRQKASEKLAAAEGLDARVAMAAKVQVVLDHYLDEIRAIKINELEQHVGEYFNLLCRKQMMINEVKIDPDTYRVELFGRGREPLYKSDLSAGEKQLYAMSLLWSLRTVSGRALPIIIDTPMGRLDSEHRQKLLTRFFPEAAHQVILLSTDTEIDEDAFDQLEPAISHAFRLEFNDDAGHTDVHRDYFNRNIAYEA